MSGEVSKVSTYDNYCWFLTNVILLWVKVFVLQLNNVFDGLSRPHVRECLLEGRCSSADPGFPWEGGGGGEWRQWPTNFRPNFPENSMKKIVNRERSRASKICLCSSSNIKVNVGGHLFLDVFVQDPVRDGGHVVLLSQLDLLRCSENYMYCLNFVLVQCSHG